MKKTQLNFPLRLGTSISSLIKDEIQKLTFSNKMILPILQKVNPQYIKSLIEGSLEPLQVITRTETQEVHFIIFSLSQITLFFLKIILILSCLSNRTTLFKDLLSIYGFDINFQAGVRLFFFFFLY